MDPYEKEGWSNAELEKRFESEPLRKTRHGRDQALYPGSSKLMKAGPDREVVGEWFWIPGGARPAPR